MSASRAREGRKRERPSPVTAAVLALVIERPSYGYDIWKRFDERFGELHPVGSARVYQVLDQLLEKRLIEHMPGGRRSSARQPRPRCRATAAGARMHREWMAESFREDVMREDLLRRLLATGARDARAMLEIIDMYEQACLDDMTRVAQARARSKRAGLPSEGEELRDLLIDEEHRLAHEGRLKFIAFARRHIRAAMEAAAAAGSD